MESPQSASDSTHARMTWQRAVFFTLFALLLVRLALMAWLPLTDTTEARYAEIARKMLETGNWVTPLHDYGIPFWAKPPLSTWLSAISMGLFGQNEFAVRLPSLLLSMGVLWLVGGLVNNRSSRETAQATVLMLASSLLFFTSAGAVMTDPALLFSTTLMLVAFWRAMTENDRAWGYAFFIGVGLGLLAKGPIALVLSGLPIFFWVVLCRKWLPLWQRLPWVHGCLLAFLIAGPWYIWAETRTPGFLSYFIVGEHLQRFLDHDWQGDKYGFAHATPYGMIWIFALGALLPWSLVAPLWLVLRRDRLSSARDFKDGWMLYLLLWTCMPLVFFSFSGNIIFPYSLPMLPGACLLMAHLWVPGRQPDESTQLPLLATFTLGVGVSLIVLQAAIPDRLLRTQKNVIAQWHALQPDDDSRLVYWSKRREFSGEFYSAGRARTTHDSHELQKMIAGPTRDFVIINAKDLRDLPDVLRESLAQVVEAKVKGRSVLILSEQVAPTPSGITYEGHQ